MLFVIQQFLHVRQPADGARNGEENSEHVNRESESLINQAGIEVNVRVQLALDEVLVIQRSLLEFKCNIEKWIHPGDCEDVIRRLLDDRGAWVKVLVDAVTESHEATFASLHAFDERRNILHIANFGKHANYCFIGATVQWAVKGSGSSSC